jgi:hypothetical protein
MHGAFLTCGGNKPPSVLGGMLSHEKFKKEFRRPFPSIFFFPATTIYGHEDDYFGRGSSDATMTS